MKTFLKSSIIFVLCVFALTSSSSAAPAPVLQAGTMAEKSSGANSSVEVRKSEYDDGKYFFDFKGAQLISVLMILAELAEINFVVGKEVSSREVNMVLDNVTLEDALEAILRGSNVVYDYLEHRDIYVFRASADDPNLPPLVTKVMKLRYVRVSQLKEISSSESTTEGGGGLAGGLSDNSADEAAPTAIVDVVENMLSERGRVNIDDRSNSLIVTDSEERIDMVEAALKN